MLYYFFYKINMNVGMNQVIELNSFEILKYIIIKIKKF